jgi:lipopolysaccharide transport protein LptA
MKFVRFGSLVAVSLLVVFGVALETSAAPKDGTLQKGSKQDNLKKESAKKSPQASESKTALSKPSEQKVAKKSGLPIPGGSEMSKLPTFIKSSSLVLKGNDRVFAYEGGVEVRQGDLTLTAASLEGKYTEKNQIDQLTAKDNVVIVKGENIRATGERAIFENATQTITLTNNPELQQEGSVLTADTIKIFLEENRSVAEGNVRVKLVKKEADTAGAPALPGLGSFK